MRTDLIGGENDMGTKRIGSVFGKMHLPALVFTLALGLLIWMKLRLVTGATRTVYAEPKAQVLTPLFKSGLRDHPAGDAGATDLAAHGAEAEPEVRAESTPGGADQMGPEGR